LKYQTKSRSSHDRLSSLSQPSGHCTYNILFVDWNGVIYYECVTLLFSFIITILTLVQPLLVFCVNSL